MARLVAIDMPGGPAFVDTLRRLWDRGDAALPLDQRIPTAAKGAVLDELRASAVATPEGETRLAGGEPVEPGDALVMATSGTTGAPKGVVLTHQAVEASARATTDRLGVDPARHRWLACLPLNHVGGLSVVTRSLATGTPLSVLPGFDAERVASHAGPDVFVSLVATALGRTRGDAFHTVVLGGSSPPANLPANVVTTYGLTETGSGVVYDGLPLDGVEVRIDAATGEISLRCAMLLRAYRDGTVPTDPDGWFATGDSGHLDHGGRLHVAGRITEMIVTGGENVWPSPIEAALRSHPKVAEAAVAGLPDPEWGEKVVAWIVVTDLGDPPALDELREHVAGMVARFAAPREIVVVDALPKTAIGKVRRDLLPPP